MIIAILMSIGLSSRAAFADSNVGPQFDKAIKASGIGRDHLGLAVVDLSSDKLIYGLSETKDMIPASITKIATGAAALEKFGPSFKFVTTLVSAAAFKGDTLQGDLVLKGGGDPGFVAETMWFLVNDFYRTGIRKITGDIIVDDTLFDPTRTDPSRDPERVDRAYDAPIGAMSFNWNSINIFVRPMQVGEPVQVNLDPDVVGWTVKNTARTTGKGGNNIAASRTGEHEVSVSGSLGVNTPEIAIFKNISDPPMWSGQNLVYFLQQRGISVAGKVKLGSAPKAAVQLAKAEGKPMSQHVADMMKFSNNYVAEMLTKNLAVAGADGKPAKLEDGMSVIRSVLVDFGLPKDKFKLVNPSGLSRNNRIAPRWLVEILVKMSQKFPIFPEYLSALPLAGVDGTLKNRMKNGPAQNWVRAKTGFSRAR